MLLIATAELDRVACMHCRAGTPVYMAPEVFRREYGVQADMWSLGMMLYHFISQRFPFWSALTAASQLPHCTVSAKPAQHTDTRNTDQSFVQFSHCSVTFSLLVCVMNLYVLCMEMANHWRSK